MHSLYECIILGRQENNRYTVFIYRKFYFEGDACEVRMRVAKDWLQLDEMRAFRSCQNRRFGMK